MKYFEVEIRSAGKKIIKVVPAETKNEAINSVKLSTKGMVTKTREVPPPLSAQLKTLQEKFSFLSGSSKVNMQNLVIAIRQIAVMTNAGIAFNDILREIASSSTDKKIKLIFMQATDDINAGLSFSQSLRRYEADLGNLTIAMIELGEKTGNLAGSLHALADIQEEILENRKKIKAALRYPIMTLIAMAIAFTVLIMYVVPKFKDIFASFHTELPLPTRILLGIESTLSNYGLLVLGGFIATIMGLVFTYRSNPQFRYLFDRYVLKVKLIGDLIYMALISRSTNVFSQLLKAGLPAVEALETSAGIIDNVYLKSRFANIIISIQRGINLTEAMRETKLYENMVLQMVGAGEASGSLDAMLEKVSDYYRSRFQYLIDNLSAAIEPIMLLFIGALVLLLALGIFMPMWDMAQAVKN